MDEAPKMKEGANVKYDTSLTAANNYRTPNTPKRLVGKPGSGETSATTFNNYYEEIYRAFSDGHTCIEVANLFRVSRQAAHIWHKSWLAWIDFSDEPPVIKQMKEESTKVIKYNSSSVVLKEKQMKSAIARSHTGVDNLRLRFLDIASASIERIGELIGEEKSVANLAKVLGALMPYVATKQDGDSNKGLTPDEKRTAFIQNVMNVYNISTQKQETDGTTEDSEPEWIDPE